MAPMKDLAGGPKCLGPHRRFRENCARSIVCKPETFEMAKSLSGIKFEELFTLISDRDTRWHVLGRQGSRIWLQLRATKNGSFHYGTDCQKRQSMVIMLIDLLELLVPVGQVYNQS